jgi:subtilase family serine protease
MTISKSARPAVAVFSIFSSLGALAQPGTVAAGGTPALIAHATDLGKVERSSPITITVWLKLHDGAALESTLSAQHAGAAPFLSEDQIQARYAPAKADVAAVSGFLKSKGLTVTDVGPDNLFVKASGTAAVVQSAFGVELHQYNFKGSTFRASKTGPTLPDAIAPLVASVGGLSTLGAKPNVTRAESPANIGTRPNVFRASDAEGMKPKSFPLKSAGADGLVFSAQCFYPPTTISFSGDGATAFYSGAVYGANINNTTAGTVAPCGYQPSDIQTAYNLTPLYKVGLDGTGETIAIVDAYGSTTIVNDLAVFSQVMGLPPAKLTVVGKPTESGYSGDANSGWADETTLDVEWVHAIAPGAKIVLVVAPTNSFDDLFHAIIKASSIPGVVSISNSWSGNESGTDIPTRVFADQILKYAGAKGQSVNFATGDAGNETIDLGYVDVNFPASSPYATAVGGVSVGLNANKQIDFQSAWGNNITELFDTIALGSPPIDPPLNEGFLSGGGGGTSNVYPLPPFQHSLGGGRRLLPDISWVADEYTGVEVIETEDAAGDQSIAAFGGTSVATPMFSALWGIASQRAGHPLGQAAPYLYELPSGAIFDVGATPTSPENVSGVLIDSNGRQVQTPWDLALPLQGQPTFISALYNSPYSTRWFVLTFGTDSTLQAGPGWDPATGVGAPNGWNFVQAFGRR